MSRILNSQSASIRARKSKKMTSKKKTAKKMEKLMIVKYQMKMMY